MFQPRFLAVTDRLGRTDAVVLLVLLAAGVSLSTVSAHYKNVKLEIPRAITIPVIDGEYDMALKVVTIDGRNATIDEWNDAAWMEIPRLAGNVTVYCGYKYDSQFLYTVCDVQDMHILAVDMEFDPKHDGGTRETKWDNFYIELNWWEKDKPYFVEASFPFPKSWSCPSGVVDPPGCNYVCCVDCSPCKQPRGLIGKSSLSTSPFSHTPHRVYEARIALTNDLPYGKYNLYTYLHSTIGIRVSVYSGEIGRQRGANTFPPYPTGARSYIPEEYADAVFSKTTNPSITVPPTMTTEATSTTSSYATTTSTPSTTSTVTSTILTTTSTAGAQFYLKVVSPFGQTQGEGQYNEGDTVTFSVSPTRINGVQPFVDAVFVGWTGASTSNEATATVIMDSDKTVTAVWAYDYGGVYFISMIVGLAAAVCLALVIVRRRRRET
jgi:hypothetical protein